MKLLRSLTVFAVTFGCGSGTLPFSAVLNHVVGNPGNPLDILFDEAKDNAASMILGLGDIPDGLDQRVRDFLRLNARNLAIDVLSSTHNFTNDALADCARTNVPPATHDILFSRPTCETLVTDVDMATRMLIHEATHHFPADPNFPDGPRLADEQFCNDVANDVYTLWKRAQDLGTPHWDGAPTLVGAPAARSQHTAVWTGSMMLIWGGCVASDTSIDCGVYLKTGAAFTPSTDAATATAAWQTLPEPDIAERTLHSAVWTGDQMLVWGGCHGAGDACDVSLNDGASYDPALNTWQTLPVEPPTPTPRVYQSAVWSGREMIIFGGQEGHNRADGHTVTVNSGGAYDPAAGHWRALSATDAPSPRQQHTAVWTGHYMVVWGGCDRQVASFCQTYFGDGKRYDPTLDRWLPMSPDNAPDPRRLHTAVWTGSRMLVWGGQYRQSYLQTGGIYDPEADKWLPMASIAPHGRAAHVAVWTGKKMMIWGGFARDNEYPAEFGEYSPDALDQGNDRWEVYDLARHPTPARDLTAVWANDHMIVWGGEMADSTFLNRGGGFYSRP